MNTLLISFGAGAFALTCIFLLCFLAVHTIKLIKLGWKTQYQTPPEKEEKKEDAQKKESAPEPVYYIVERKRRAKTTFSEPKRIDFK